MDNIALYLSLLGFVANILVIVVSGTWVISKINTKSEILGSQIENLGKSIDLMSGCLKALTDIVNSHSERIVRIETKLDKTGR